MMFIISDPPSAVVIAFSNLRVFGPGLNPFSPFCVAHHSSR
ncbi:hypothetical protein LINGRAHAP2_LOCUS32182 [Linum grandiflorum]